VGRRARERERERERERRGGGGRKLVEGVCAQEWGQIVDI
jgi:hypothetical protein